jgi:hypothetical protein
MATLTIGNDLDFTNYLGSTTSEKVQPLSGEIFFDKLKNVYTSRIVSEALKIIFLTPDTTYKGMKAFQERITASFLPGHPLSGADQVYLNNYCLRLFSPQAK